MSKLDHIHQAIRPTLSKLPDFASILIVDDQRFDRMRLMRLCAGLDFETHLVEADSLEAMGRMLAADTFDLIFLDYHLPDGTGLQGIDIIAGHPTNGRAATVMIAGSEDAELAVRALKGGCSDYITKDELSPDSLLRAVINALQKSSLTTGLETQEKKRQEMQQVLKRFSGECAQEIKPVVSRMMRQMRDLREPQKLTPDQFCERIDRIEKSCSRLWEFLDDLENYCGGDLARETYSGVSVAEALDLVPAPSPAPEDRTAPATPAPRRLVGKSAPRPSVFGRKKV